MECKLVDQSIKADKRSEYSDLFAFKYSKAIEANYL